MFVTELREVEVILRRIDFLLDLSNLPLRNQSNSLCRGCLKCLRVRVFFLKTMCSVLGQVNHLSAIPKTFHF
jgi:hypothetical protein